MRDEAYNPEICDNAFRIVNNDACEWVESNLGLPPGYKVKRLHTDAAMGRFANLVRFPPGYIEPAHHHQGWHCILVQKGRMCVAGRDLRPGDYVFGWDLPHGPFEYPDGCEIFGLSLGKDMHHVWDEAEFLRYQRQWQPETEEGRKGCAEFDHWRAERARVVLGDTSA